MSLEEFLENEYPRLCRIAFRHGKRARIKGLPKNCNLTDKKFFVTPSGNILIVYREAWERGYENGLAENIGKNV